MKFETILCEGEALCPKCDGAGGKVTLDHRNWNFITCLKCKGIGKVDWIQKAMGVMNG